VVETLAVNPVFPEYDAVMECDPMASDATESEAVPDVNVPCPRPVAPSLKVTVPDRVPVTCAVTVAVKVMDWPNSEGFVELATVVVVGKTNPLEVFSRTLTPPIARSGRPSPFTSPVATPGPLAPREIGDWRVPSPFPSRRTSPTPEATSIFLSPLKSASTSDCTHPNIGVDVVVAV
jgi:hypothetical protein